MSSASETEPLPAKGHESETRILDDMTDAVVVLSAEGRYLWANKAATRLLALDKIDLAAARSRVQLLDGAQFDLPLEGGRLAETRLAATEWRGRSAFVAVLRDVSERRQRESRLLEVSERFEARVADLEAEARHDPLTGVANRRGLADALKREAAHSHRVGSRTCALLCDLDDFKAINDQFGHAGGDRVLVHVARVFESLLRPLDHVARIGGDEFLIVLPDTRRAEGVRVAERLRRAVESEPLTIDGQRLRVTISVGVARVPAGSTTLEAILLETRDALKAGKASGKNTVGVHHPFGGTQTLRDGNSAAALDPLATPTELRAVRQEIRDLESGSIVGFEYLTRTSRAASTLSTAFFSACPDEPSLTQLDLDCLVNALAHLAANPAPAEYAVHLNVLPTTLSTRPLEEIVALFPSPVPTGRFCIEISEQQLLGDPSELRRAVYYLKSRGFGVALDDVGFGRSSLETLVVLEPDIVKLDRRSVLGVGADRGMQRTLERLARIAATLGARCYAVGIADEADRKMLVELGIKQGQGFLWGLPR